MPIELATLDERALATLKALRAQQGYDIKLVFFDIDGTLINSETRVLASAKKEIQRLQDAGIKTAIASGRPPFACKAIFNDLAIVDAGMFFTGAMLYDPKEYAELSARTLNRERLNRLIDVARNERLHIELYTSGEYLIEHNTEYCDYHNQYLKLPARLTSFDDIPESTGIYKALIVAGNAQEKQSLEELKPQFDDLRFYTGHGADRPDIDFVSIIDSAACKQRAFEQLCAHHCVSPMEVMAIGDAHSDIAFIKAAGTGVAMGNASSDVQAQADFVTGHVDDGGLGLALTVLASPRQ